MVPQGSHVLMVDRDADFLRSIHEAMRRRAPPIVMDAALSFVDALRQPSSMSRRLKTNART
jgi:hypothetical protein